MSFGKFLASISCFVKALTVIFKPSMIVVFGASAFSILKSSEVSNLPSVTILTISFF